jgi:hypothetical protein
LLLANLHLAPGRLDEAERYAHRAREIDETLDLSSEPWKDYSILAQIADKRGRAEEARQWRRKEQETYQAYVDRSGGQAGDQVVRKWEPYIQAVVAICNGDAQAAQQLEPFLQKMANTDDWRNLIAVIRRILAGERGIELTEGLDHADTAIVRRILGLLAGERPSPQPSPNVGRGSGREAAEGEGQSGISLEDLVNLVVAGARGDAQAGGQAYQIAQALQQPGAPPEYMALGQGFQRVLEGLRGQEAVQGLPEEAAEIVRAVLKSVAR